jgi:transcription initiation factor TFIIB
LPFLQKTKKEYNIEYTKKCPDCSSSNLIKDYQRAEIVCKNCGLVVHEEIADRGPEWRAFDKEQKDKKSRAGPPIKYTLPDKGLSTVISPKNRDSYGRSIPTRQRLRLYRIRKMQRWSSIGDSNERNFSKATSEINRISSRMNLPRTIRERASMIYLKAAKKNLIRGRGVKPIAVAAIYLACRLAGIPRTLDELGDVSRVPRKEIGRTYRFISRKLKLKTNIPSPSSYVSRFCSELKLSQKVKEKSLEILKKSIEQELTSGRGPVGLAAAAIYISTVLCDEKRTQRQVAETAGVTEVTIRNRYREIVKKLDIHIEP